MHKDHGFVTAAVIVIAPLVCALLLADWIHSEALLLGILAACALASAAEVYRRRKRANKRAVNTEVRIVGALALGLAVAAVVWALSERSGSSPATARALVQSVAPTQKIPYLPPGGGNNNGGMDEIETRSGAVCVHSEFDPYPRDALRCVTGGQQIDPCFPQRVGLTIGNETAVVCPLDPPWVEQSRDFPVLWVGVKGLGSTAAEPRERTARWKRPWALELTGGVRCIRHAPTSISPSPEAKYECVQAGERGYAGSVLGFPEEGSSPWEAEYVPSGNQAAAAESADVVRAWE